LTLVSENPSNPANPVCPDASSQWCEGFGYDIFGNRLIGARTNVGVALTEAPAYNLASNRITGSGWGYDARGNILNDPSPSTYTYDAESRQVSASGGGGTTYVYDGDGQRVKKVSGGTTTVFVYDAQGQLAAEYSSAAGSGVGRNYLTVDHLGSTRMVSNATGAVLERHDYRAFGDEVTFGAGSVRQGIAGYGVDLATRLKFTGKERDVETGLDYFGARYLSSAQGRWTSPDWSAKPTAVPHAEFGDPQTLNLDVYVGNRPLSRADADGHQGPGEWVAPFRRCSSELGIDGWYGPEAGGGYYTYYSPNQVAAADQVAPAAQQQLAATTAVPMKDKEVRAVKGASGKPALIPAGFDVNQVVTAGRVHGALAGVGEAIGLVGAVGASLVADDLAKFARGGPWDLQRQGPDGTVDRRFIDSATILIGMYGAAAGIPAEDMVAIEAVVAQSGDFGHVPTFVGKLPVRNVVNTYIGYGLIASGGVSGDQ